MWRDERTFIKCAFGMKMRTWRISMYCDEVYDCMECSRPNPTPRLLHSEIITLWNILLQPPSFASGSCLKYLYPDRMYCVVLHVFELCVSGILEEEDACAAGCSHSPLS